MGWVICDFWPFLLLPHVSSEMPIEVRNNMSFASRMQFEVLRRALCVQQARTNVFEWKFWERAAQDPKMTCYLRGCESEDLRNYSTCEHPDTHFFAARA